MGYSLKDEVAIITGAGSRIGKGIALEFARARASIVVVDIKPTSIDVTVGEIQAIGCA